MLRRTGEHLCNVEQIFYQEEKVRTGSVVLLVGVGSLVCWRLWAHWRYGAGDEGLSDDFNKSSNTSPARPQPPRAGDGSKYGLLASLLEEELCQDEADADQDDPAFIQGRYFGPDKSGSCSQRDLLVSHRHLLQHGPRCRLKECLARAGRARHGSQRQQLLGTVAAGSGESVPSSNHSTPSEQRYMADHSSSSSSRERNPVGSSSSSSGDEGLAKTRAAARTTRRRKRQQKVAMRCSSSNAQPGDAERKNSGVDFRLSFSTEHEADSRDFDSSAGPDDDYSRETNRDDIEALYGSAYTDLMERMRCRHSRRSLSREPSISSNMTDFLMSPASQRRFSFRRDDSVCSNLSDFAVSECSELSMDISVKEEVNNTFRHLDEIEQDLDELKSSVLQMDEEVAMFVTKPDPYSLKITYSDYSLSSKEETDSLPRLCEDLRHHSNKDARPQPSLAIYRGVAPGTHELPLVPEAQELGSANGEAVRTSDTEAEGSLEWDSPQHGWSEVLTAITHPSTAVAQQEEGLVSLEWDNSAVKQYSEAQPIKRQDSTYNFHDNTTLSSQLLPDHSSMELDMEDELRNPSSPSLSMTADQPLLLPDTHVSPAHATAASDTAEHLTFSAPVVTSTTAFPSVSTQQFNSDMMTSTDSAIATSMTASDMAFACISNSVDISDSFTIAANMTGSTDSAIYSAPGSRSATASPLPAMFSQSNTSSAGIGSLRSTSGCCGSGATDGPKVASSVDHKGASVAGLARASSLGSGDRPSNREVQRSGPRWSSDESGFAEPESDGPHACLSPVREGRERTSSASSSVRSSPRHMSSSLTNLRDTIRRRSTEGLNVICNETNDNIDHINGNDSLHQRIRNQTNVARNVNDNCSPNINDRQAQYQKEANANIQESLNANLRAVECDDTLNGNINPASVVGNQPLHAASRSRSSSPASRQTMTIGEKVPLLKYCQREWRGSTHKADVIRKGYSKIQAEVGLSMLRCIRGDQYCGVRATVFQALASGHPLPRSAPALARLVTEMTNGATWILGWTFANRIHYGNAFDGIRDCLETLDNVSDNLVGCADRDATLEQLLNSNHRLDLQLCEAVKLHMLASALQLYSVNSSGGNVPLFAMILFARESSQTPAEFMTNHLTVVGDTGGLEQIEMFLLGHALKATLQVVRPASYGAEDFICYYPDTNIGVWPQLSLIAEDDRHYNVLVE